MPDNPFTIILDAPTTPAAKLQVAKIGQFNDPGRHEKFAITPREVESWNKNLSVLPGGKALIDFDHRADKPGAARDTTAAGWIHSVSLQNGVPMADVEWTAPGRKAIEEGRYAFFSPTYGTHKTETGEKIGDVLLGGALSNRPFLSMPAISLASQENVQRAIEQGDPEVKALAQERAFAAVGTGGTQLDDAMALAERFTAEQAPTPTPDAAPSAVAPRELEAATLLEQDPRVLEGSHEMLDRVLRMLERELGCSYADALGRWQSASRLNRQMVGVDHRVQGVLGMAGVKQLDGFASELRLLDRRDQVATRLLESNRAVVALDVDGGLPLAPDFDLPAYRRSGEMQERRWLRARALPGCPYGSPGAFHEADMMSLEGGSDMVAGMEAPVAAAGVRQHAMEQIRQLDAALEAPGGHAAREKALDQAVLQLEASGAVTPADDGGVRTLDNSGPIAFTSLDGSTMLEALRIWREADHRISLDDAASAAAGKAPAAIPNVGPTYPNVRGVGGEHTEIDRAVKSHMLEHGCSDYRCGLQAITGVPVGDGPHGTFG